MNGRLIELLIEVRTKCLTSQGTDFLTDEEYRELSGLIYEYLKKDK